MEGETSMKCRLTPFQHMKANSLMNAVIIILVIISMLLRKWFYFAGGEYSLREMSVDNSGWIPYYDFKDLCRADQMDRFKDLKDNCEQYRNFQMAGYLVSFM